MDDQLITVSWMSSQVIHPYLIFQEWTMTSNTQIKFLVGLPIPMIKLHNIIRGGLDRSPMYTGVIEGVGPRYCPSIEDKIHRFADKESHQIFLEPEGLNTHEVYPNGISTSLPFDVQYELVRSIKGLENAFHSSPRICHRV